MSFIIIVKRLLTTCPIRSVMTGNEVLVLKWKKGRPFGNHREKIPLPEKKNSLEIFGPELLPNTPNPSQK